MKARAFINRIYRALKFDATFYKEMDADKAGWQAFIIVVFSSLATGIGFGVAHGFKWAGAWYLWMMLFGLVGLIIIWLALSFFIYFFGTKAFSRNPQQIRFRKLLYAIGFSISPGLFGIFICIPIVGSFLGIVVFVWTLISGIYAIRNTLGFGNFRAIGVYLGSSALSVLILFAVSGLSLSFLVSGTITQRNSFDNSLNAEIRQQRFNIVKWELTALSDELRQWFQLSNETGDEIKTVVEYFSSKERQVNLNDTVEKILEKQIHELLREEGINVFPPVKFELGKLPDLIVVSPRDRIISIREVFLDPDLTIVSMEDIETRVDGLGVSSLVVQIGGFAGVYPSYVTDNESLQSTISAAIEEWVHQYLAFKPLGFRYLLDLLGISPDYDIATMNETVAGIVSDELASVLIEKYYPEHGDTEQAVSSTFSEKMAEIRKQVDDFLLRGEIKAAEDFMNEKRQDLAVQGFYIRKLNQAYFAWHNTYANQPGFITPIGEELMQLKAESSSLREFLNAVAGMNSSQDLSNRIE